MSEREEVAERLRNIALKRPERCERAGIAPSLLIEAADENAELRRELDSYWRAYHAEHCTHGDEWPHKGTCGYGPPAVLQPFSGQGGGA